MASPRGSRDRPVLQVVSLWPPSSLDTGEEVEDQQLVIDVAVVVRDDGRVGIDGDDLNLTMWNHDPDRLQSALDYWGHAVAETNRPSGQSRGVVGWWGCRGGGEVRALGRPMLSPRARGAWRAAARVRARG